MIHPSQLAICGQLRFSVRRHLVNIARSLQSHCFVTATATGKSSRQRTLHFEFLDNILTCVFFLHDRIKKAAEGTIVYSFHNGSDDQFTLNVNINPCVLFLIYYFLLAQVQACRLIMEQIILDGILWFPRTMPNEMYSYMFLSLTFTLDLLFFDSDFDFV